MPELTPEKSRNIYEEEKVGIKARKNYPIETQENDIT